MGHIYAVVARYRSISEYPIARDFAQRALESFRQSGEWRGLAAYFGVGADIHEGNYESGLENLEQALKLIGDRPAAYARTHLREHGRRVLVSETSQEGIDYLKKAITYYERTDHKTNAADGYNNLGINLILIGQWDRAQEALGARVVVGERGRRARR